MYFVAVLLLFIIPIFPLAFFFFFFCNLINSALIVPKGLQIFCFHRFVLFTEKKKCFFGSKFISLFFFPFFFLFSLAKEKILFFFLRFKGINDSWEILIMDYFYCRLAYMFFFWLWGPFFSHLFFLLQLHLLYTNSS